MANARIVSTIDFINFNPIASISMYSGDTGGELKVLYTIDSLYVLVNELDNLLIFDPKLGYYLDYDWGALDTLFPLVVDVGDHKYYMCNIRIGSSTLSPTGCGLIKPTPVVLGDRPIKLESSLQFQEEQLTSNTSIIVNWNTSNFKSLVQEGNCSFTFVSTDRPCSLSLKITNNAIGGYGRVFPSNVKWENGVAPSWTTAANKTDIIEFYFDGQYYYGKAKLNF